MQFLRSYPKTRSNATSVVPATAGIQHGHRANQDSHWIPAFAGMTLLVWLTWCMEEARYVRRPKAAARTIGLALLLACCCAAGAAPNASIAAEPYLTGGLFTNPVIPQEGQEVIITLRAALSGGLEASLDAQVTLAGPGGKTSTEKRLPLEVSGEAAQAAFSWTATANGLYRLAVMLDPDNRIAEENEDDNTAELLLPVTVAGRAIHFPWYREVPFTRWATCVTSSKGEDWDRLAERGVLPLAWAYGGMSWSYFDKERAKNDPEAELADLEALFYGKYSPGEGVYGFGVDECGGYPGSWKYRASVASMKGLIRAKKDNPDRFFAVWNAGGLRPGLAEVYRQGADLLLLETYIWRALPQELGAEDVYQVMLDRIEPVIRSTDMFQPAYGNHCYTLMTLDTSERPDRTDLGEQEQVVRLIRRRFPEMRGIGWYTGGYGNKSYGMVRTDETDRQHDAVRANADRLCFEYWVKPCVTLMRESLWLGKAANGAAELTAAVSNIGGIDAGATEVEFFADGVSIGTARAEGIPAGAHRNANRVLLKVPVDVPPGHHHFRAVITKSEGATLLDSAIETERHTP